MLKELLILHWSFQEKKPTIPNKIKKRSNEISLIPSEKKLERLLSFKVSISQVVNNYVGILRNKKDLLLALNEISSIKKKDLDENDIIDNRIMNLKQFLILSQNQLFSEKNHVDAT